MRNLSALVSTFQTPDGDKVGMDSFVLSRDSIDRRRQNDHQVISLQAKLEFLENLPEHLVCHWDGKMIEDLLGILNEAEAIVASGGNVKYKVKARFMAFAIVLLKILAFSDTELVLRDIVILHMTHRIDFC